MTLPIQTPYPPMEALLVDEIPADENWQYEPKWDGFRCLVFRDREEIELQSKSGQSLTRYFPELVELLLKLRAMQFVLDAEIAIRESRHYTRHRFGCCETFMNHQFRFSHERQQ
ncbi:MAG: hypothetical protein ACREQ7_06410 [Candidatus Binatia bacterium]